jgi:hypothetical protein
VIGRIGLAVLFVAILTGCSSPMGDPVVDGWAIGPERSCETTAKCPALLDTARVGLDRRDPGHPAVVSVTLHTEGATFAANGDRILHTRSGSCCSVARFELADGSVKAIGVGYPGVSQLPMAIDYGP